MDKELIEIIVKITATVISVLITSFVIPWIKSKIDSTKYNDFLTMVEMCVEAANQIYTPEEWQDKKKYVLGLAIDHANKHGVNVTMNEIDAIIEGFVKAIKEK